MKNYTNRQGYILALIVAFIYAFISKENFDLYSFLGGIVGALLMNSIVSGIITVFWKFKNFGKVLGIASVIICSLAFLGNRKNDIEQKEKVEIERKNLSTIDGNYRKAYNKFQRKLTNDNRKDILNNLISSNDIVFEDTKLVLNKIDEATEYYSWIEKTNDSLFKDLDKQLEDYKLKLTDETKKYEVEKFQRQTSVAKMNTIFNYSNVMSIIFEMRNLISIRNNCKHQNKNGKLIFFTEKCIKDWNIAQEKYNENVINLSEHRNNLINQK